MGRYQDALDYIYSYVSYDKKVRYPYSAVTFNLSRMEALLDKLGCPQTRFQCVHIAGTKGKGSTSAMVESVLRNAGYRTGLFTSPHLHTWRERVRVDGRVISKQALVELLDEIRPAIEDTPDITAFEIMTTLAFAFFAKQEVEWAVLEVGLGGRLDATNVVYPAVCGITSLSYDHVELLGHTLSLIAWEKAGIIKSNVPVVTAPQEPEAMGVIQRVCDDTGAQLVTVGEDWTWEQENVDLTGQALTVRGPGGEPALSSLRIKLLGRHQLINATTAVAIVEQLRAQGLEITEAALRRGMGTARWPGRFEALHEDPVLIVDSAHNANSAGKLRAALAEWFPRPPRRRMALIFGASADKDIDGMLEVFLTPDAASGYLPADKVIVTKSGHPRSADPAQLADLVRGVCASCPISVQLTVDDALTEALSWAQPGDLICVTGSIFAVAQARRAWAERHPETFEADDWAFQDETPGQKISDDDPMIASPKPSTKSPSNG
jgi:dihydrofolate synthase / folylpolyglutamate synthase